MTLQILHENGFVHGDVWSANILYDQTRDRVALIDFGFAGNIGDNIEENNDRYIFYGNYYNPQMDVIGFFQPLIDYLPEIDEEKWSREMSVEDIIKILDERIQNETKEPIVKEKGGIDFDPKYLNLEIKRDDNGAPLGIQFQPTDIIEIEGLTPVIIQITPITNLPLFLGLNTDEHGLEYADTHGLKISLR